MTRDGVAESVENELAEDGYDEGTTGHIPPVTAKPKDGVTWEVGSEEAFKAKHVAALGSEQEFERRKAVANEKADGLDNWREQQFMRTQFVSIACQLTPEQFAIAKNWTPDRWARLVYKLAGI